MANHSSVLAWRTLCTEQPGGLQSMGSQRVRHDLVTKPPPKVFPTESFFHYNCLCVTETRKASLVSCIMANHFS